VGKHFFSPKGDCGGNCSSSPSFFVDELAFSVEEKEVGGVSIYLFLNNKK
jgi:NADH:ubiquinone oxidoreductase subunit E